MVEFFRAFSVFIQLHILMYILFRRRPQHFSPSPLLPSHSVHTSQPPSLPVLSLLFFFPSLSHNSNKNAKKFGKLCVS